jgi:hypothetical protein
MKIASYNIGMQSSHSLVEHDEKSESLRLWTGNRATVRAARSPLAQIVATLKEDSVQISAAARRKQQMQLRQLGSAPADGAAAFELSDGDKLKLQLIQDFIEAITGKKVRFVIPEDGKAKLQISADQITIRLNGMAASQPRYGWGMAYDFHQYHFEAEQTTFAAAGVVKTADGRQIDFSVAFAASRQYSAETNISIRAGDALTDPLAINFAAPTASLTAAKYAFDLDADGDEEQISFVGPGSGFLALDKNGDGIVSDGSELFGPQSGNGFSDLAAYDSDGNNWIDENDPIYEKLVIWTKDETGNDRLFALGAKGVGAIYLGNVATEFSHKDNANQLQGQLRTSGVFLREDGGAGTVQQIDLAV